MAVARHQSMTCFQKVGITPSWAHSAGSIKTPQVRPSVVIAAECTEIPRCCYCWNPLRKPNHTNAAMSAGLFLLGTDGGLQQMLLHPSTKFTKSYIAQLGSRGLLDPDAPRRFAEGLTLADGTQCQPATLEVLQRQDTSDPEINCPATEHSENDSADQPCKPPITRVRVECCEGMYHQVKRMIGECGGAVCELHRESMGPLRLGNLEEGAVRNLTIEELRAIKELLPLHTRDATERRGVKGTRNQKGKKRQYA